jgi:hypothetical protein
LRRLVHPVLRAEANGKVAQERDDVTETNGAIEAEGRIMRSVKHLSGRISRSLIGADSPVGDVVHDWSGDNYCTV